LSRQLEESHAENAINSPASEKLLKRITQLEDQVRARDLVIDLLYLPFFPIANFNRRKAEKERIEKEFEAKLQVQRQQLEQELGLALGSPSTMLPAAGGPIRTQHSRGRGVGRRGRRASCQSHKSTGKERELHPTTLGSSDPKQDDSGDSRSGGMTERNCKQPDTNPVQDAAETRGSVAGDNLDTADAEAQMEAEINDAFEELFNDALSEG
jgi:hypothetical protein